MYNSGESTSSNDGSLHIYTETEMDYDAYVRDPS